MAVNKDLENAQKKADEILKKNNKKLKKQAAQFSNNLDVITEDLFDSISNAYDTLKNLENTHFDNKSINKNLRDTKNSLESYEELLKEFSKDTNKYADLMGDNGDKVKDLLRSFSEVLDDMNEKYDSAEESLTRMKKMNKEESEFYKRSQEFNLERLKDGLAKELRARNSLEEATTRMYNARNRFTRNYWSERVKVEKEAYSNIRQEIDKLTESIDDMSDEMQEAVDDVRDLGDSISEIADQAMDVAEELEHGFLERLHDFASEVREAAMSIEVDQILQNMSDQVDGFIENRRQILSRTGSTFRAGNLSGEITKALKATGYGFSRNEMSEIFQQAISDTRIQDLDKLNDYIADMAAMQKVYGTSIESMSSLMWQDSNSGQEGKMFRNVANMAAALEDNGKLYTSADSILEAINEKAELMYGVARGDVKRQKNLLKSVASIQSIQETAANAGVSDFSEAIKQLQGLGTMGDYMESEVARQMAMALQMPMEDLKETVQSGNLESLYTRMYDSLQGLNEGDFYLKSKAYGELFGGSAPMMAFAAQDRDEFISTLREVDKTAEEGLNTNATLVTGKLDDLTSRMDVWGNMWSDNPFVKFIADRVGELDISLANAAHGAVIASNLASAISGIPKFLSGVGNALSKLFSGKTLGNFGAKMAGAGGRLSSLFGVEAEAGTAAAAGPTVPPPTTGTVPPTTGPTVPSAAPAAAGAGKAGITAAGVGTAALHVGGVAAGAALAVNGFSDAFNENKNTGTRALGAVEGTAGVVGAGSLLALGISNPVGWIALAVGGITYLAKKAYENATALSGNGELYKKHFKEMKKVYREENVERLKQLTQASKDFENAKDMNSKKQILEKNGIASIKNMQGLSEQSLNVLLDSYKDAAAKMNSVTDSLMDARGKEVSQEQSKQQKEILKDIADQIKSKSMSQEDVQAVFTSLMSGVTDEELLKKFDKYMENDNLNAFEINDLLNGGLDQLWDETNLEDQAIDIGALEVVNDYYTTKRRNLSNQDNDYEKKAADVMSNLQLKLGTYRDAKASGDSGAIDAAHKELEDAAKAIKNDSKMLEFLKSTKTYKPQLEMVSRKGDIPAFQNGLSDVPNDGLAILHKGEAVLTKEQAVQARADGGIDSIFGRIGSKIKGFFEDSGIGELILSTLNKLGLTQSYLDQDEELTLDTLKFHKQMRRLLGIDISGGDAGTSGSSGKGTLAGKFASALGIGGSSGGGLLGLLTGKLGNTFGFGGGGGNTTSTADSKMPSGSVTGGGGEQVSSLSGSNKSFIDGILPYAKEAHSKYNIPMAQILGQAAYESGWGTSSNAKSSNCLFGVTAYGSPNEYWDGSTSPTGKYRKYASVRESVMDYARLLHDKYGVNGGNWQDTLASILPTYCSDAGYYDAVADIITSNGLDQYRKGTAWLPEDQVAMVHKGEMIVPAEHNPLNSGGKGLIGTIISGLQTMLKNLFNDFGFKDKNEVQEDFISSSEDLQKELKKTVHNSNKEYSGSGGPSTRTLAGKANSLRRSFGGNSNILRSIFDAGTALSGGFGNTNSATYRRGTTGTGNLASSGTAGGTAGSTGIGTFQGGAELSGSDNKSKIWNFLRGQGLSSEAAAGIMGSFWIESGFDPGAIEGYYLDKAGAHSALQSYDAMDDWCQNVLFPSYAKSGIRINKEAYKIDGVHYAPALGLAQWTGGRTAELLAYGGENGWYNLDTQLSFLMQDLQGDYSGLYNALQSVTSPEEAAKLFRNKYEGSKYKESEAQSYARDIFNELNTYAKGSAWLPSDQIALIHQGEMIVPAEHNPMNDSVPTENIALTNYDKRESESVSDYAMYSNNGSPADYSEIIGAISSAVRALSAKLDEVVAASNSSRSYKKVADQTNTGFLYSL